MPVVPGAPVPKEDPRGLLEPADAPEEGSAVAATIARLKEGSQGQLTRSLMANEGANPDRQARVRQLAKKHALPFETVDQSLDEFEAFEKRAVAVRPNDLLRKAPGLSKWMSDPKNAGAAMDDTEALTRFESAVRKVQAQKDEAFTFPGEMGNAAQTGWQNLQSGALHLGAAYGLAPDDDQIYQAIADSNVRAKALREKAPVYATEWSRIMQAEGGDVDRAIKRFADSFESLKRGEVTRALKEFGSAAGTTVWETLDAIGAAVNGKDRLKGLAYSGVENLANSLPSLVTGFAGAKAGAAVGAAAGSFVPGVGTAAGAGVGGAVGLAAGTFTGSVVTEVGSWINEQLQTRGFDMTNPDEVRRAYRDPELMAEIRGEAERKGLGTAAVDAAFSLVAGRVLKGAKGGLASKAVHGAADVGVQAVGEAASEAAGQAAAKKGDLAQVDFGEALLEGITSLGHSMGETAVGATVAGGKTAGKSARAKLSPDPVKAAEQVAGDTQKAIQAQQGAQALTEIGQAVEESKTAKRMPEALAELIQTASEGGDTANVYFQTEDWDAHWSKQGLSPAKAAEQILGNSKLYHQAKQAGAALAIPLDDYVSKVATTEHFGALLPFARTREDGMTLNEAKEYLAALPGTMEELAKEASGVVEEAPAQADPEAPSPIGARLESQLTATGRYSPSQAKAMATLSEAFFETTAKRLGIDPQAFFEKYAPQIQGEAPAAVQSSKGVDELDPMLDRIRSGDLPSDRDAYGQSLGEMLREKGGISPEAEGSSLAAIEPDAENKPFTRNLVREGGMSADQATQIAIEQGFLPEGSDVNALIDALGEESRGSPTFSPKNEDAGKSEQLARLRELQQYLGSTGVDLSKTDNATAKKLLSEREFAKPVTSDDLFLQQEPAPAFYSKLTQTIEQKMGNSAPVDQVRAIIRDVKDEERKWSGIDEFLKSKEKVTKQELLDFLRANQLEVREVSLGDPAGQVSIEDSVESLGLAKYSNYTLPGGENYREVLFTLPVDSLSEDRLAEAEEAYRLALGDVRRERSELEDVVYEAVKDTDEALSLVRTLEVQNEDTRPKFIQKLLTRAPGADVGRYVDAIRRANAAGDARDAARIPARKSRESTFQSSHFSEPNILAHARLNERTDVDGKRVLFIEEIQSDWHQAGREQGYKGETRLELKASDTGYGIFFGDERLGYFNSEEEAKAALELPYYKQSAEQLQRQSTQVPDAPFRKTWHEFVLKRVLRMAAEQGFDRIAWTTGEQQAERYSLARRVESVYYSQPKEGLYQVRVTAPSGDTVYMSGATTAEKLETVVGKELTKQIVETAGPQTQKIYGLDLKVGGEGMKGFYDKIIPAFLNKFTKKYGAKVGATEIQVDTEALANQHDIEELEDRYAILEVEGGGFALYDDGEIQGHYPTRRDAELDRDVLLDSARGELQGHTTEPLTVHSLDITDQLRNAALTEGFPLFQGDKSTTRGFFDPKQNLIGILKDANLSTYFHETGHYYLETLNKLVADGVANEELKADYQTLLDFIGAESFDKVERKHHEKAARAFEAYVMEGKAPSEALRGVFYRFRAWLISVYQALTNLNVKLTPEVRGVFDRLLATDTEIAAAQSEEGRAPLIEDPLASGMSEKAAASYLKAVTDARRAAEEALSSRVMSQVKRTQEKWWKEERLAMRAQVQAEVDSQAVFQVIAALSKAQTPAGEPLPNWSAKLSRKALVEAYGEAFVKDRLPKVHTREEGGLSPDAAAEIFGFTSGDEMVMAMANAPDRKKFIEAETDRRMREKHGDILMDGKLPEEAVKAVHNEKRAQLLRKELEILATESFPAFKQGIRAVTRPLRVPDIEVVRRQATKTIGGMKVRELRPSLYQQAEARAGREAVEAFLKGDREQAFRAKERELLNHELYRAAVDATEVVESGRAYARKFSTAKTREMLGKAGEDYLEQADDLIDRFDFRRNGDPQAEKRKSLAEFVASQEKDGLSPVVSEKLLNEGYRVHYREMPYQDFRDAIDALKSIEHLARLSNKLLRSGKQRAFEAVRDEAIASIEANSKGPRPKSLEPRLPGAGAVRGVRGFFASHRKFSSLIRQMDGYQDGGALWETLVRPMNDAGNAEAVAREKATTRLHEIFKEAYPSKGVLKNRELYRKQFIPEIGGSLTKMGRLMVALNWGNADNRQKLMDGRDWNEAQVRAVLSGLDARDWQFVQQIWDFVESFWPQTAALAKRVTGVVPAKVESVAVETPFGVFRGGYFPLKYESRQAARAAGHTAEEAAKRALRGATVRSTTRQGHRKERVENVQLPVRLDFGVLFQHVNEVIHDLTHHEFLIDANRILGDRKLQETIFTHYGDQVYRELKDALNDVAAGDIPAQDAVEQGFNYLRKGVTVAYLGLNLSTALQQPLGIIPAARHVGYKHMAKGLGRLLGDAARMESTAKWIHEQSDFMRLRAKTQQREINEIQNEISDGYKGDLNRSFFYLISKAQMVADIPTWLGGYEKAMASKKAPQDPVELEAFAIAQADQAVLDTQGGGQMKDLAKVQRGSAYKKLFTSFYSYFSVIYNRMTESVGRTNFKSPVSIGVLAVDTLHYMTLPALAGTLVGFALKGAPDDEDELVEQIVRDQLGYAMGLMVGVRELGGLVQGFRGYEGPAGTRFFSEIGKLATQAGQGEADEAFWRALNKTGGILFHYPAGQIDRTVRGMMQLQDGETTNPGVLLMGPERK